MAKLLLTNSNEEVIIDDNCIHFVNMWNWYIDSKRYILRTKSIYKTKNNRRIKCHVLLHREIYQYIYQLSDDDMSLLIIDHINRNTLDNRLSNLRSVTSTQNAHNRSKMKNNTSGYVGVNIYRDNRRNTITWRATILNPITHKREAKLFPFTDQGKIDAALWYDAKAKEYFKEYCGHLNF